MVSSPCLKKMNIIVRCVNVILRTVSLEHLRTRRHGTGVVLW